MSTRETPAARPLLTLRTLVLILVAAIVGASAVALTIVAEGSLATAALAGAGSFAASLKLLHELVE
jgi:hypothetical protein